VDASTGNSPSGSIEQAAAVVKTASGAVEYVAVETSRMAIARALIVTSPAEVRWARELRASVHGIRMTVITGRVRR